MKEFQLEIIRYIQQFMNPLLDNIFILITQLGEETLAIALMAILFFGYKKQIGKKIMFFLLASLTLNNSLKFLLRLPRPIGEVGVITLRAETATGFSFPSGHAQMAGTLYPSLIKVIKKQWYNILTVVIVILVALSRVYLGVHYPIDAIVGAFLGIAVVIGGELLFKLYKNETYIFGITSFIFLPFAILFLFDGEAQSAADFFKVYGLLIGVFAALEYEKRYINFKDTKVWKNRIIRVVLAMVIILGIKEGVKLITPDMFVFDFLRYFLMAFVGIGLYPHLFATLKIDR
jgi:membrane-associated phospholipid phosphatase